MNGTKVIRCTKCQELTWNDDFHKLNGKPYCTICIKEVLLEQVKKQKEIIDKAINFTNENWGSWCSNHFVYMTELQNILKGGNDK